MPTVQQTSDKETVRREERMSIATANDRASETVSGSWRLDRQRSSAEFRVKLLWGLATAAGHFDEYDGRLDLSADPAIELTIDASSVQTGIGRRDRHLRSADFFDVENHPQVRFVSEEVEPEGDKLRVHGRLSAGGRSIPIELDAQLREVDDGLELDAATAVAQSELGMMSGPLGLISARSELRVKAHLVSE